MSGMCGVTDRTTRLADFTDEEREALRKDDATSTIVNKARRDAGFKETDVEVRGDDLTLDETLHGRQTHVSKGEAVAATAHAYEVIEAVSAGSRAAHALEFLGRAPHVVLPLIAWGAAQYGMVEMEKSKIAMKDAATRDQLHAAILDRLDVPGGFKQEEMKRLGVSITKQSAASKVSDQFGLGDKHLMATLQLHCDQGMNAARDMIAGGTSTDEFLKANKKVADRYAADPAFKNGFDALVWSKKDSPATFKAQIDALDARDVRYCQANIAFRI